MGFLEDLCCLFCPLDNLCLVDCSSDNPKKVEGYGKSEGHNTNNNPQNDMTNLLTCGQVTVQFSYFIISAIVECNTVEDQL